MLMRKPLVSGMHSKQGITKIILAHLSRTLHERNRCALDLLRIHFSCRATANCIEISVSLKNASYSLSFTQNFDFAGVNLNTLWISQPHSTTLLGSPFVQVCSFSLAFKTCLTYYHALTVAARLHLISEASQRLEQCCTK